MAHTIAPFYAVRDSVGKNSINNPQDVMLVQFFLFSIMIDPGWPSRWGAGLPAPGIGPEVILPADGIYRPALVDWIKAFQEFANMTGNGPLTVDGVVSHGGPGWGHRTPSTHHYYTIHAMNHMLFLSDKERFYNLAKDGTVPPGLQGALSMVIDI